MENTNNRTCGYVGCTPAFKSGKTTAIEDGKCEKSINAYSHYFFEKN